jgi:hypothetical protein
MNVQNLEQASCTIQRGNERMFFPQRANRHTSPSTSAPKLVAALAPQGPYGVSSRPVTSSGAEAAGIDPLPTGLPRRALLAGAVISAAVLDRPAAASRLGAAADDVRVSQTRNVVL